MVCMFHPRTGLHICRGMAACQWQAQSYAVCPLPLGEGGLYDQVLTHTQAHVLTVLYRLARHDERKLPVHNLLLTCSLPFCRPRRFASGTPPLPRPRPHEGEQLTCLLVPACDHSIDMLLVVHSLSLMKHTIYGVVWSSLPCADVMVTYGWMLCSCMFYHNMYESVGRHSISRRSCYN